MTGCVGIALTLKDGCPGLAAERRGSPHRLAGPQRARGPAWPAEYGDDDSGQRDSTGGSKQSRGCKGELPAGD
jgi:hypothetical protein